MTFSVYVKGRKKATITKLQDGRFLLDVNRRVKVSERQNRFKDYSVMEKYLDWLFGGKYQIVEG